jgi:transposase InsO family protein
LASLSQAPKAHGRKLSQAVERSILRMRSELEAAAASGQGLKYIGPAAIRTRLRKKGYKVIPSYVTIARVLRRAGMSRPQQAQKQVAYPHLSPTHPLHLIQVDIVPHFLSGGMRIPCFNAIDVVSRYPTGKAYARRCAEDAADFLIQVWQEIGIPHYTQVDNEGCFSGGATHPYVLGQVVRLALLVGTELLFSPIYYPKSNSTVERFHQDYNQHVWQDTYLRDLKQVRQKSSVFFARYRQSEHHTALNEHPPAQVHAQAPARKLVPGFKLAQGKLPLYPGRLHFLRRVSVEKSVSVLNVAWPVPAAWPDDGVWVTIELTPDQPTLAIYDQAPDASTRRCLATHPFPLADIVLPSPNQQLLTLPS